jgi:hypothetical protein
VAPIPDGAAAHQFLNQLLVSRAGVVIKEHQNVPMCASDARVARTAVGAHPAHDLDFARGQCLGSQHFQNPGFDVG